MKTATISFAGNEKKDVTITGQNLTLSQDQALIHIKDGAETVFTVFINQLVHISFNK